MGELREILEQLGFAATCSKGAENIANGEPRSAHARLAKADSRVDCDAIEQIHLIRLKLIERIRSVAHLALIWSLLQAVAGMLATSTGFSVIHAPEQSPKPTKLIEKGEQGNACKG